jgi:hypothetical protein
MTDEMRKAFIERLEAVADSNDCEMAHSVGDDVLCEALIALGYEDIVEAWDAIEKWYC